MDQASKLRQLIEKKTINEKSFRVITVSSGKGGVGKSNFVVNLSVALNKKGYRVAILDADFGMANVDILFGAKSSYTIYDILTRGKDINEIIVETNNGIKIIPGGSGISKVVNLSVEEEEKILNEFEKLKDIDILLIDTGAGISNNVINFVKMADDAIIITNNEPTSITDAYGLMKVIALNTNVSDVSIVVNKSHCSRDAEETYNKLMLTSKKFLNLNTSYLGYIFEDSNVSMAVRKQVPLLISYPRTKASKSLENICDNILDHGYACKNVSLKGYLSKLFNVIRR